MSTKFGEYVVLKVFIFFIYLWNGMNDQNTENNTTLREHCIIMQCIVHVHGS